jgi:4-oxalocrotonate tautomerase
MPYANLKVPAGLVSAELKEKWIHQITDMYAEAFGDDVRPNTMVHVEEVADGGWGIGDAVLTLAKLTGETS